MTPGDGAPGVWAKDSSCTNIVMLHIKSKVMKSRIQWCKKFARGGGMLEVTRGQKVRFWVLFFYCHPTPHKPF